MMNNILYSRIFYGISPIMTMEKVMAEIEKLSNSEYNIMEKLRKMKISLHRISGFSISRMNYGIRIC